MITAGVSALLGMVGGVLPKAMEMLQARQQSSIELRHMETQARLQIEVAKANADSKMREVEGNIFVEEMRAFKENLTAIIETQGKPTGIVWVDAFNALLRPVCVTLVMALFMMTSVPFVWAVIAQFRAGAIDAITMKDVIFGSLVGESVLAIFGFLFGYRSAAKRASSI
jgi:hypothetical protein